MDEDSASSRRRAKAYSLLAALGTALVLAYLVTELQVRVFPGDHFALFIVAFLALLLVYLLGYSRGRLSRDKGREAETSGAQNTDIPANEPSRST